MESVRFTSLGSECELFAVGVPGDRIREAEGWVRRMHDRLTRFEPASELARFNAAAGAWVAVSAELAALLQLALDAFASSGGLVHAGILPALEAAGYTRDFAAGPTAPTRSPGPLAPLPTMLELRGLHARLAPGSAIDLGGLAKGWLADRLTERLGPVSLANLGGDLFARGAGPDGTGWPVGVGLETVLLLDMGAATSGSSKREWAEGFHHLIDPRTGRPAETDLREVSVIARSGAEAEVLAKTAFLLGRGAAEAWLEPRALGWSLSP